MEILYGILLLIVFIVGFGIGLAVPFFVKEYLEEEVNKIQKVSEEKEEDNRPFTASNIPQDVKNEWFYGADNITGGD